MFNYIIGRVAGVSENLLVIENNGIGFELTVSSNTINNVSGKDEVKIYTYLYVREDNISLIGFYDEKEKMMFLNLISISGIGPKAAISILSGISVSNLTNAILNADVTALSSIKGIGKKTAERVVLELKNKLDIDFADSSISQIMGNTENSSDFNDAINVLLSLGITRNESVKVVEKAIKSGLKETEDIISFSLKNLNR